MSALEPGRIGAYLTLVAGIALALGGLRVPLDEASTVCRYQEVVADARGDREPDQAGPPPGGNSAETDFEKVMASCPAAVATLVVEGTSIALPVAQASPDDPSYWLTHDLWGAPSTAGSAFVDARCRPSCAHVVVCAHHLSVTGGMFSELAPLYRQESFDQALTGDLVWSTPAEPDLHLHPVCALVVDEADPCAQPQAAPDAAALRAWLHAVTRAASARAGDADRTITCATRAVTLVTCASQTPGQRLRTAVTFAGPLPHQASTPPGEPDAR